MDDRESLGGQNDGNYQKLFSQEDSSGDEQPSSSGQEEQQVFVSVVHREPRVNSKVLTVCLAVLAVVLLVVDIGLGVYYNKLTSGQRTIRDFSRELTKLQNSYDSAIGHRDDAKKELALERNSQQMQRWEIEHLVKREKDYTERLDKVHLEIVGLKSKLPMLEEGCQRCLPGWIFINPTCYYLPWLDTAMRRTWWDARKFCQRYKGDLAMIDSTDKHLALSELINNFHNPSESINHSGFWIGLQDVVVEGIWRWLDGRRLNLAFWNDGEPNDVSNEDCAATYPRKNPFKAWNDAPCSHHLRWICEIAARPFQN